MGGEEVMDCGPGRALPPPHTHTHLIEMQRPTSPKVKGQAGGIYRRSSLSGTFVAMLRTAFIKSARACLRARCRGRCIRRPHPLEVAWPWNRWGLSGAKVPIINL